jgi:hypothetical protein
MGTDNGLAAFVVEDAKMDIRPIKAMSDQIESFCFSSGEANHEKDGAGRAGGTTKSIRRKPLAKR